MRTRTVLIFALIALLGFGSADAQVKKLKKVFQRGTQEERVERARVRARQLAEELYATDDDFRESVDDNYRKVLLAHAKRAYRTNTSQPSKMVVVREDRFRIYESIDIERPDHEEQVLYDNLMVQAYVNRLGQSLVPAGSRSLYAFRLVVHPIPFADTLATGTIYVSTGLVGMLENEAQLAYVLAHEMAHVHLDHWKDKSLMLFGAAAYLERQERKRAWKMLGAGIAGAAIGHQIDDEKGGAIGFAIGAGTVALMQPSINLEWELYQEDEADKLAFEILQKRTYDIHEVRNLYANLQNVIAFDTRASLGFIAQPRRLRERLEHAEHLIAQASQNQAAGDPYATFIIDTGRFKELLAELRRDNGIQALFYDMFYMARENLKQAVDIRSNDPTALYYYGKVLELLGRNEEDMKLARQYFEKAAANDSRNLNFGAHLHAAMTLLGEGADPAAVDRAGNYLQAYIGSYSDYQLKHHAFWQLPPHLDTLYDYMALSGQAGWVPQLPEKPPAIPLGELRKAATTQ